MKKLPIAILILGVIACQTPKEKIPEPMLEKQTTKPVIYQMLTRLFGNKSTVNKNYGTLQENGVGKLNDINETALLAIKELGITHVWYTGVIEHALLTDYTQFGIAPDDADVVKGRAGSPYAIKDYYDVNPDLAVDVKNRIAEFEALVERTHAAGLKVIIDFVPNHVARAYKSDAKPAGVKDLGEEDDTSVSFKASNNFYYLPGQTFQPPARYNPLANERANSEDKKFIEVPAKVTGNDQFTATPGVNEWFETIKLNYGVDIQNNRNKNFDPIPNTWVKMKDILVYWAQKGVDGFRCDMAEMVPVEFWQWAVPQVKAVAPQVIFIAEIYNPQEYRNYIHTGKFDLLYDKVQLYDTLRNLTNGHGNTNYITGIQQWLSDINPHMLHFLENHDEQRIASKDFAGDAWKAIPAMVISATIDKAPVMIYFGQEVGEPGSGAEGFGGEDGRTTIFDYWGVPEHQKWMNDGKFDGGKLNDDQKALRQFYGDILKFSSTNPAIVQGAYYDLTVFNQQQENLPHLIHVFARVQGEERLVIVSGFNNKLVRVKIRLSDEVKNAFNLQPNQNYIGRDLMRSGADIGLDNEYAFEIDVPAYSSYIFKIKN
ncbi:MAG TPA: alpha-amylase family protein [Cyclobacteriaceae bacterium]|jgi:glycosidase|nr:alpha-amylase family protein [Cytophagales bacterium]HRF32729.1 alpha-amylase family protein [Cyclobacteriaceae bacterium]